VGWEIHKQKSVFSGTYKICKLAANVPDLVVFEGLDRPIPDVEHFHGVLLFADISGFTSLTERYTKNSKKGCGADHLTRELNGYISEIVDHILQAGGDIVNYAGDAMLALWRERRKALSDIISLAVKCSLNIQDKCDNRDTEIGVKLRVKIGISAGKLSKVVMGDHESRYYALIGCAVDEVRKAEGLALANTIILSPNAWELCDRDNIVVEQIENDRAVKVRYIKRDPQFSVEDYTKSFGNHLEYQEVIIGRKVNLAARLMMTYPGVVSCDEQTHYHAKMPSSYFSELPKRAMKGVQNPGPIYQYLSKKHQK
uniref:Guanylate cyclase domain-containing protein n=1 Tax=Callorhinchus milii TaxID=7868 RepID=A0A4W3HBF1_CALMI